jgi:hypothetical protein
MQEFCEAAMLNSISNTYLKTRSDVQRHRKDGQLEFGWVRITSCQHEWWWYHKFIGLEFLVLFPGLYGCRDVRPTRSIGHTKILVGNGIPIEDVTLI